MSDAIPATLSADRLMQHMQALCKEIGPRPSASPAERRAAEYVKQSLQACSLADIQEQPFNSWGSLGWVVIPVTLLGILAVPTSLLGGTWGRLTGGAVLLLCGFTLNRFYKMRSPCFEALIARGDSQNVIATLPPLGAAKRRLFLIGHLDSNKQRFLAPPPNPLHMKIITTSSQVAPAALGALFLTSAFSPGAPGWLWLVSLVCLAGFLGGLFGAIQDERQPHIEGANDNATAVSILLGIAGALGAQPLQNTEVTLLFTGCEEVGCTGMENYIRKFKPPRENTYWIDLEMVGTGNLAYVTRHGISPLTRYAPSTEMLALAEETARAHPELQISGKKMLIAEEVAGLRQREYRALCIAGYNDAGWLPNWHRLSDCLENIEPATLERAAHYTWRLMEAIDSM